MATVMVKVVFFGLSMLVPNDKEKPTGMTVLMPDTHAQQYASDGCRIPDHEPVLLIRGAQASNPGDFLEKLNLSPEFLRRRGYVAAWSLRGLEVSVSGQRDYGQGLWMQRKVSGRFDSWPDSAEDAGAVDWIWQGSSAFQQRGVDVSCLRGTPEVCPIAARVLVGPGEVRTCRLAALRLGNHGEHAGDKRSQGFQGRDQGSPPSRLRRSWPLPTAFSLSLEIEEGAPLVMKLRKFEKDEVSSTVEIRAMSDGLGGTLPITIWIGNSPLVPHAPESVYCDSHDRDRHFELFYLLTARDPRSNEPRLAKGCQTPTATRRRIMGKQEELQPADSCEVPDLTVSGTKGPTPEFSGVCGTAKGG